MDAQNEGGAAIAKSRTNVERPSDREVVVTRTFNAPARIVYEAWSKPELFQRWWAPKSMGVPLIACDMDVRTGGKYRLEFRPEGGESFVFFGKYLDVVPRSRIVWTNDEGEEGAVTTVTFEEQGGKTLLTYRDVYPSKEALEESMGATEGLNEQYGQLDDLLSELTASGSQA